MYPSLDFGLDFEHRKDVPLEELKVRILGYYPEAETALLEKAYNFALKAHEGQKRSSGEPYIIHPLNVALTLSKLRMDLETVIAGILHDVVEDCGVTLEIIAQEFSVQVAYLVDGLTKLSKIKFKTKEEGQAENFRKMVVAMAKDLRVIIIKLADRIHNMCTLEYVQKDKQLSKAQETLDIYVPLASRLGINSIKTELEDLSLRYLRPDIYYLLADKITLKKSERDFQIQETVSLIQEKLSEYAVEAYVKGRPKNFYSIYRKMTAKQLEFEEIQDLLAFRIIVNNITECYKALGVIHSSFTPIPGRFKDYIAIPKKNKYQSLHTAVIGPRAERIEVQIRTTEMDETAERGIAAHWKYKEGVSAHVKNELKWVEELLEYNQGQGPENSTEFLDLVKNDLDFNSIFIFTPKGDVRELPMGATPLDFAYSVHTDIGNKCVGAKVDGKIVPLRYSLKSGETVEILTNKTQSPTKDWIKIVKTSRAKTKIKQWLLKIEREKNIDLGRAILEKSLQKFGAQNLKLLQKSGDLSKILSHYSLQTEEEFFLMLAQGSVKALDALLLISAFKKQWKELQDSSLQEQVLEEGLMRPSSSISVSSKFRGPILIEGNEDIEIHLARCCSPILGDTLFAHVTKGRGIAVHVSRCPEVAIIQSHSSNKGICCDWNPKYQGLFNVSIKVSTVDKQGILSQISRHLTSLNVNIKGASAKSIGNRGLFVFEIQVRHVEELSKILSSILAMEEVLEAERLWPSSGVKI